MNQLRKLDLIRKIRKVKSRNPRGKEILISIDDYFKGNDEKICNILTNTLNDISSAEFEMFLRGVTNLVGVSNVYIRFFDYEDALDFDDSWINSDTVYIVTKANIDEVEGWFNKFQPSDIYRKSDLNEFANLPCIEEGFNVIGVWWD